VEVALRRGAELRVGGEGVDLQVFGVVAGELVDRLRGGQALLPVLGRGDRQECLSSTEVIAYSSFYVFAARGFEEEQRVGGLDVAVFRDEVVDEVLVEVLFDRAALDVRLAVVRGHLPDADAQRGEASLLAEDGDEAPGGVGDDELV